MSKAIELLSAYLGMDANDITAKLDTDDGVKEIETKLSSQKVDKAQLINNYRSSLTYELLPESLKASIKDELYGEIKGSALEKTEKDLLNQYGINDAKGTTWNNTKELVALIAKKEADKVGGGDDVLRGEINTLQAKLKEANEARQAALKEQAENHKNEILGIHFNSMVSPIAERFDIKADSEDEAKKVSSRYLDFVKFDFESKYNIDRTEDGKFVVKDKNGDVLRDENHVPKDPSTVLNSLVEESHLPLKVPTQTGGRGKVGGDNPPTGNLVAKYGSWENFTASEEGKGLIAGSKESMEAYKQFKDAEQ